jgi:lipopolysaccharide transport system ATP-binding protein
MSVLQVNNVGKAYRKYGSELKRVASWFGLPVKPAEEHWVLHDINFSIQAGEAIGIIGQNGAGKSTLLKMITGTLPPTKGNIQVNGRIAAILELGMGFNPDFTGRQNAQHGLAMMGFSQSQIEQVMPELEAFAEVGEYFDQPVRTYSSGMQMRVAFGVATAFRPEILIVDEALSVGDAYFQHKSFDRIKQFREQGTTLLFVSHDKSAILALCNRAILIEAGLVVKDGDPEEVTDYYNALIAEKENSTIRQEKNASGKAQTISGTGEATVVHTGLYNQNGQLIEVANVGDPVELRVKVKINQAIPSLVLGYGIKDRLGQVIFGTNTWHTKQPIENAQAGKIYHFSIQFPAAFGIGSYTIVIALTDKDTHLTANYEWRDMACLFSVVNIDKSHFAGLLWQQPTIQITELSNE